MNQKKKTLEKIPTWAICAIEYGDYSGLSDDEIKMIKDFFSQFDKGFICDYKGIDEPYFTSYPAFGLPCDVIDTEIIIL